MDHRPGVDYLLGVERIMLESFENECGEELAVVDEACALLGSVLVTVGPRTGEIEIKDSGDELTGDIAGLKLAAHVILGIRVFRTVRAARAILAFGYEREAPALDRILVELRAHQRHILEDESGREALAWLARERTRNISARVNVDAPEGLYANLSMDSHGDPAPVGRLRDPETGEIDLAPRRGLPARTSLCILHAGMARDQAVLIARHAGIELEHLEALDERMSARRDALGAEAGTLPD